MKNNILKTFLLAVALVAMTAGQTSSVFAEPNADRGRDGRDRDGRDRDRGRRDRDGRDHYPPHRPQPPHRPTPPPYYPPHRPTPPPYYPPAPPRNDVYLNQYLGYSYAGYNVMLPLSQLLGVDYRYIGMRVDYVTVVARSNFGQSYLQLAVNNRYASNPQYVGAYTSSYTIIPVYGYDRITDTQSLMLQVNGNMYIESIAIHLTY